MPLLADLIVSSKQMQQGYASKFSQGRDMSWLTGWLVAGEAVGVVARAQCGQAIATHIAADIVGAAACQCT